MATLFEMSLTSAIIAIIIIVIRKMIQNKVSKRLVYGLWALLLISLLSPVRISSEMSIFNYIEMPSALESVFDINKAIDVAPVNSTFPAIAEQTAETTTFNQTNDKASYDQQNLIVSETAEISNELAVVTNSETLPAFLVETSNESIELRTYQLFQYVWLIILISLGLIMFIMQFKLSRRINESTIYMNHSEIMNRARKKVNLNRDIKIYSSTHINTPLVYGIIKPRIILPSKFVNHCSADELAYVVTHEMVHIKRLDYIMKPISLVLLLLHWFNPILWLSFLLVQKDMEMSCDERVILAFEEDIRKGYASSLVNLAEDQNHSTYTFTLAFGENNIKSRVKSIMTSKNKAKWITAVIIILLIPLAVVLLTGRTDKEDPSYIEEIPNDEIIDVDDPSDVLSSSEEDESPLADYKLISIDEERFDDAVSTIVEESISGRSKANIQSDYSLDYQFIMDSQFKGIYLLSERLDKVVAFVESSPSAQLEKTREKIAIEWLISDIIKNQAESPEYIRNEYSYTITVPDICYGRLSPSVEGVIWTKIPKNSVLHLTGFYDMDWQLAQLIVPDSMKMDEVNDNYMRTDQVEFWIHSDDFRRSVKGYNDVWSPSESDQLAYTYASEFKYIINGEMEAIYNPSEEETRKYLPIHILPDNGSATVGFVDENDLVSVKKDDYNQEIRQGDWVLIGQFDQGDDSATIGWIESKYMDTLTENANPNQGFILRGTEALENRDGRNSSVFEEFYKAFLQYSSMQAIKILDRQDGWIHFEDYGHTVAGWIKEEDVFYQITPEVELILYNSEPELDTFVAALQSEILHNPEFAIEAKDVGILMQLTDEEKAFLANSITTIESYQRWEGGISPNREALYPYYSLEFGDYSMLITYDKRLMLLMGKDEQYSYGIGTEGSTVRWVTPNTEFLVRISELLPIKSSDDPDHYNYLFNADNLAIYNIDGDERAVSDELVHINKCLRAVRNAMGDEIVIDDPDEEITDRYEFVYTFEDGSQISVIHTNRYIFVGGKYYESLLEPHSVQVGLFAGYF